MWGAAAKVDRGGRAAPGRIMRRHASVHPPTSLWLGLGGVLCPEVGEGCSRVYSLLLILVYENWYQGLRCLLPTHLVIRGSSCSCASEVSALGLVLTDLAYLSRKSFSGTGLPLSFFSSELIDTQPLDY